MGISQIELRLRNFKSYTDSDWIKLNGKIEIIGENRIDGGSNGSGKSSILEAIWVLVKQSKSDAKSSELKRYIRKGEYDFSIDAKIIYDDKEYSINSTSRGIQCDNAIKKGLTDLYYSFLLQGMPNSFANLKPADRKEAISIDFDCDNLVDRSVTNLDSGTKKVEEKRTAAKKRKETAKEQLVGLNISLQSKQNELNQVRITLSALPALPSDLDIGDVNVQQLRNEKDNLENQILELRTEQAQMAGDLNLKKNALINERDAQINAAINAYNLRVGSIITTKVKNATKVYNEELQSKYESDKTSAEVEKKEKLCSIDQKIAVLKEMLSPEAALDVETSAQISLRISQFLIGLSVKIKKSEAISAFDKTKDDVDHLLREVELQITQLEEQKRKVKANAVKKPSLVDIKCYTPKNKPKRNIPANFIVNSFEDGIPLLIENKSAIISDETIREWYTELPTFNPPDVSDVNMKIAAIENNDISNEIARVNEQITIREQRRTEISRLLSHSEYIDCKSRESKLSKEIENLSTQVRETEEALDLSEKDERSLDAFADELKKARTQIKSDFANYVCDLVCDNIAPLTGMFKKQFFNEATKLAFSFVDRHPFAELDGRDYEYLSGGEQAKVRFIFALAYREYLNAQTGAESSYLFCDEVFDGMDPDARAKAIDFVTKGLEEVQNIILISHQDRDVSSFKKLLVVKASKGNSVIQS
jgi:ABC-type molybdenum transport system ATPase subunit/photorepair protein PhrA